MSSKTFFMPSCTNCFVPMKDKNGFILSCGHFVCNHCDNNPTKCKSCQSSGIQAGHLTNPPPSVKDFIDDCGEVFNLMREVLEFQIGHYKEALEKASEKIRGLQKEMGSLSSELESERQKSQKFQDICNRYHQQTASQQRLQESRDGYQSDSSQHGFSSSQQSDASSSNSYHSFFQHRQRRPQTPTLNHHPHHQGRTLAEQLQTPPRSPIHPQNRGLLQASPQRPQFRQRTQPVLSGSGLQQHSDQQRQSNAQYPPVSSGVIQSSPTARRAVTPSYDSTQAPMSRAPTPDTGQNRGPYQPSVKSSRQFSQKGTVRTAEMNSRQPSLRPVTPVKRAQQSKRVETPIHRGSSNNNTDSFPLSQDSQRPLSSGSGKLVTRPHTTPARIRSPYIPHLSNGLGTPGRTIKRKVTVTLQEENFPSNSQGFGSSYSSMGKRPRNK